MKQPSSNDGRDHWSDSWVFIKCPLSYMRQHTVDIFTITTLDDHANSLKKKWLLYRKPFQPKMYRREWYRVARWPPRITRKIIELVNSKSMVPRCLKNNLLEIYKDNDRLNWTISTYREKHVDKKHVKKKHAKGNICWEKTCRENVFDEGEQFHHWRFKIFVFPGYSMQVPIYCFFFLSVHVYYSSFYTHCCCRRK